MYSHEAMMTGITREQTSTFTSKTLTDLIDEWLYHSFMFRCNGHMQRGPAPALCYYIWMQPI